MTLIERAWYKRAKWLYLLLPLSWIFQVLIAVRRKILTRSAAAADTPVPVVVIGNISVGGTGKTPLLIFLCRTLQENGYKPGVISRGYGAAPPQTPFLVDKTSDPAVCGDEPALIAEHCGVPVVVDPDRLRAYRYLVNNHDVDVVISDDGMQHYRLPRHMEIAVVDGARLFANRLCLPAGPLREPLRRLREVDMLVVNGEPAESLPELFGAMIMTLNPRSLVNLKTGETRAFNGAPFKMGDQVQAVAGIGNPERFFSLARRLPYPVSCFSFPDHHAYSQNDFMKHGIDPGQPIVMTEKDGIKCRSFATDNFWVLKIEVALNAEFADQVLALINHASPGVKQEINHAG
jgi:tetraacyldisaccharide 4'-kinase